MPNLNVEYIFSKEIVKIHLMKYVLFIISCLFIHQGYAQDGISYEKKGFNYKYSFSGGLRLRTDGWCALGEYAQRKKYNRSMVYLWDIASYKHPKMKRQSIDPNGGIFGGGAKPFVYGKRYSLLALQGAVGQRHLLAEQAKKNGVLINFQYLGGISLGILKPYFIDVYSDPEGLATESITYNPDNPDIRFLDISQIAGGSGFGKGWQFKFRPGLHFQTGFQFDWSSQEDFIKAVEIGFSYDEYFKDVPLMAIVENKARFFNLYMGIQLGKKKKIL